VPGGESRGFVHEKQFGIAVGRHHLPLPFFKMQQAGKPGLQFERAEYLLSLIVQLAAVTHPCAARGGTNNITQRVNPVLKHRII
jgi:hypothetical protein